MLIHCLFPVVAAHYVKYFPSFSSHESSPLRTMHARQSPRWRGGRQQLPHAQVVLVDDANHLVVLDQTDVIARRRL
jgi:hypothetical protein